MKFIFIPLLASLLFMSLDVIEPVVSSEIGPKEDKMQMVAGKVLEDLKRAKGILPHEKPGLVVRKFRGSEKLANMNPETGDIHLDSRLYTVCSKMNEDSLNALAFILSHELGHYINKHNAPNHSVAKFEPDVRLSNELKKVISSNSLRVMVEGTIMNIEDTRNEAQADFEGGFIGYLAGYQPTEAGKKLLTKVYDGSNQLITLADTTQGYPTFNERLTIVEETAKDLEPLKIMFEMANYMAALDQYAEAAAYYENILEKYQSREIYNNIGVLSLYEALGGLRNKDSLTLFDFPIILDIRSRIDGSKGEGQGTIEAQEAINTVNHAIEYFTQALYYDKEYPIAHLNLAVGHTLIAMFQMYPDFEIMDEQGSRQNLIKAESACYHAEQLITKTIQEAGNNTALANQVSAEYKKLKSDIFTQLGIIKSTQGDTTMAVDAFNRAININSSHLACFNLNVIRSCTEHRPPSGPAAGEKCTASWENLVLNGKTDQLFEFYSDVKENKKWTKSDTLIRGKEIANPSFKIEQVFSYFTDPEYHLYYSRTKRKPGEDVLSNMSVILVPNSNTLTSECGNLSSGSLETEVYQNYGVPSKILQVGNGQLLVYKPFVGVEALDENMETVEGSTEKDGVIFHIVVDEKDQIRKVKKWVPFYMYNGAFNLLMES